MKNFDKLIKHQMQESAARFLRQKFHFLKEDDGGDIPTVPSATQEKFPTYPTHGPNGPVLGRVPAKSYDNTNPMLLSKDENRRWSDVHSEYRQQLEDLYKKYLFYWQQFLRDMERSGVPFNEELINKFMERYLKELKQAEQNYIKKYGKPPTTPEGKGLFNIYWYRLQERMGEDAWEWQRRQWKAQEAEYVEKTERLKKGKAAPYPLPHPNKPQM